MLKIKEFSLTKKVISFAASIGVIVSMIIGIISLDDRYAKGDDVKDLEKEVVDTLKQFQKIQSENWEEAKRLSKLQYYSLKIDMIRSTIESIETKLKEDPNNPSLLREYDRYVISEGVVQKKIDKLEDD